MKYDKTKETSDNNKIYSFFKINAAENHIWHLF